MIFSKLIGKIKQILCDHNSLTLLRWHRVMSDYCNFPAVESEYKCDKCGKITYLYWWGKDADRWMKMMGDYKRW